MKTITEQATENGRLTVEEIVNRDKNSGICYYHASSLIVTIIFTMEAGTRRFCGQAMKLGR